MINEISGNLITTGQTLTTNIDAVSSNLVSTGSIVDDISGNLITTGQTLQTQITSNDGDISTLTTNLITTGQTFTSEIAIVSGLTTGSSFRSRFKWESRYVKREFNYYGAVFNR